MQDGGPARAGRSGDRLTKRRRIEDVTGDAAPTNPEAYEQWDDDAQNQASQPYVSGQDRASFSTGQADFSNPAAAAGALSATEGSSWQASDTSAYPDLATYQQQPYFYGQNNSTTANYNTSWTPATTQAYGDTSVGYSVNGQTATTSMPFFPPSTANVIDPGDGLDGATAFNYPDVEHASQYASYTQPSATAALAQREAAKSSAYYFDDASMHLKIQSLPILDNLVCCSDESCTARD